MNKDHEVNRENWSSRAEAHYNHPEYKVKEFLDIEGRGHSKIKIYAHIDNQRAALIDLPGTWSLSSQTRNVLRTQDGILKILEQ